MIVCGASTRGRVARRVLGSVPVELIQRARRPVLVISPSSKGSPPWSTAATKPQAASSPPSQSTSSSSDTRRRSTQLKRAVGALDLTALGLGAIIGTGIFVIIGEAIATAGPSIILSFVLAGVTCVFSALAFAELSSAIPVSGSAYTYSYATLGELAAWIIGWDLILEYGVSIAGVAIGWGAYLNELLDSLFGYRAARNRSRTARRGRRPSTCPAMFLVLAVGRVLMLGYASRPGPTRSWCSSSSACSRCSSCSASPPSTANNFTPVLRRGEGLDGTVTAATLIFFAYIGFDAVSTSSEEVKEPSATCRARSSARWRSRPRSTSSSPSSPAGALPFKELAGPDAPLADGSARAPESLGGPR